MCLAQGPQSGNAGEARTRGPSISIQAPQPKLWNRVHSGFGKLKVIVSRHFADDDQLSADFLLVTTGCQETLRSDDSQLSADLALKVVLLKSSS